MSASAPHILVVDDEPSITDAVSTALGYEGYRTTVASSGREAWTALMRGGIDLAVLDVMLPDMGGVDLCRQLRQVGDQTPVLFLTARTGPGERIAGLRAGGDDYVEKPFVLAEVLARIDVILRRVRPDNDSSMLRVGDVVMAPGAHRVSRAGTVVELTATEFRLLQFFMENPNRVLSKSQILDHVWRMDFAGDANVVETYVKYVRRKLDALGPPMIHTIRLVGYVMRNGADAG